MDASQEPSQAFSAMMFVANSENDISFMNDILTACANVPVLSFYMQSKIALPAGFENAKVFVHGEEAQAIEYISTSIVKATEDI